MRVFVAGAGGVIGSRLVTQLLEHGHEIVATTRSPDKLEGFRTLGAEPTLMDGLDASSVAEAPAGAARRPSSTRRNFELHQAHR